MGLQEGLLQNRKRNKGRLGNDVENSGVEGGVGISEWDMNVRGREGSG